MLIQAAIDLAKEAGLLERRKQEVGPVIGVLNLGKNGEYEGFTKLGRTENKRYIRSQMWMPRRNGRVGKTPKAEYIVDKAGYLLGLDGDNYFSAYRDSVKTAADATGDEGLKAFLVFLNSSQLKSARKDYEKDFEGLEGTLFVSFKKSYLHERPKVMQYWLEQEGDCLPEKVVCSCCGKEKKPARLHPKISGGGLRGSLISFNSNATDSYGFSGAKNFPVCPECTEAYSIALQRLLKEDFPDPKTCEPMPRSCLRLSDTTVAVYWGEEKYYIDIRDIFENGNVAAIPTDGNQSRYHYAVLSQLSTGRLTIREYRDTVLTKALQNLRGFYSELETEFNPEFVKRPYTPYWYQYAMVGGTSKKVPPSFTADFFECAINPDIKFSNWMYNRALNRVMKRKGVSPALASIIKAVLIRNYGDKNMNPALNPEHPDVAYQFGRVLAVVEHIHRRAIKSNQTLADTLLISAATRPTTVQLKLERKFALCAKKLRMSNQGGTAVWYTKLLNQIMEHITSAGLPAMFSPQQQGLFIMGYHHQQNELWKPKASVVESEALAAVA